MPVTTTKEEAGGGGREGGIEQGGRKRNIKLAICLVKNLQPASS